MLSITTLRRFVCGGCRALAVVLASGCVWPAVAQDAKPPSARPYRGLFAGGNPNQSHQLALTWSGFLVRDDNVTAGTRGYDPMYQASGVYADVLTMLAYRAHGRRASFSASTTANGRYFPDFGQLSEVGGQGDAAFTLDFGKSRPNKTSLSVVQSFTYQPFYAPNLLSVSPSEPRTPGAATGIGVDALTTQVSRDYAGTAKLAQDWGGQSAMTLSYEFRRTQLGAIPSPFLWQVANSAFTHKVTKYGALKLGYGYGKAREGAADSAATINQNIDIGIDYSRPLSSTRRTSFAFSSGSSIIGNLGVRYYRMMGDATVAREIGRSWNAKATYHRGLQYVEGIAAPLFADTGQLRLGGLVTKRFDVAVTGGYSSGQIGLSAVSSDYVTSSGTAEVRFALARSLSVAAEYHYYRYDFGQSAAIPAGIPSVLRRQGFRIGVSGWSGLIR